MATTMQLSVLASYDDLLRCASMLGSASCESAWLLFLEHVQTLVQQRDEATAECRRLQDVVSRSHENAASSESKLAHARKLLDQERRLRKTAEAARESMERQLNLVRDILLSDNRNKLHDETKEKLAFLNSRRSGGQTRYSDARLDTITELDATGMLLGDLSYSRSEDDLDMSVRHGESWRKHVSSAPDDCISPKRRRSSRRRSMEHAKRIEMSTSDRLVATTTVTVDHTGTKASSKIETGSTDDQSPIRKKYLPSAPPISDSTSDSSEKMVPCKASKTPLAQFNDGSPGYGMGRKTLTKHEFIRRVSLRPDDCNFCGKLMKFAKYASKCRNCNAICHNDCESLLPLPCVPIGNTHAVRGTKGTIADYTPMSSPMVPALVVHCIQEVEARGLDEVGIYRVPGAESQVKALKEKFLRGRGVPNLSKEDIHVICGTLKDFLRSLREPLILRTYWHDFVQATEIADPEDARAALYQVISELPQPNRDTLATLILHLQHVAECPKCKMPTSNLAKIFGPTIVGYSSSDLLEPQKMYDETVKQSKVVESLLRLPGDYWANFAMPSGDQENMLRTPSTTSMGARSVGTTPRSVRGKKKFFPTPPMFR